MRRALSLAAGLGLGLAACGTPAPTPQPSDAVLGPNDVSVLFPLPADGVYDAYLGPGTQGAGGPLIPHSVFDVIPAINPRLETAADPYTAVRAVAIRFDPCFTATTTGSACEPQIRMIFQMVDATDGPLDGAMHAFYRLTPEQFGELVGELRHLHDLAPENETLVMGPSPALTAQGLDGAYGTALFALVTHYAGAGSLRRVTFMERTAARQTQWKFGFFEVEAGVPSRAMITEIDVDTQTVNQMIGTDPEFLIDPIATTGEDLTPLLTTAAATAADPTAREAAYRDALSLENPGMNQPDEVQCGACHVASSVARQAEESFGLGAMSFPERFQTDRAITTTSDTATDPEVMRIFGWFDHRPAIAPRAVHETAAVLDVIDVDYPVQR